MACRKMNEYMSPMHVTLKAGVTAGKTDKQIKCTQGAKETNFWCNYDVLA